MVAITEENFAEGKWSLVKLNIRLHHTFHVSYQSFCNVEYGWLSLPVNYSKTSDKMADSEAESSKTCPHKTLATITGYSISVFSQSHTADTTNRKKIYKRSCFSPKS